MKKLLFVFLLLPVFCLAQYDSTKFRQEINAYGYTWKNVKFRSSTIIPYDTIRLAVADSGAIAYKGGKLWSFNGHYWSTSEGGGLSVINVITDSSFSICDFNGCDTFYTTTNPIQSVTVLNDSTLLVCYPTSPPCDTFSVPRTQFFNTVWDSSSVYNAIQQVYSFFSDTSWTNQFMPNHGVITDTVLKIGDSLRVIYTDGTERDLYFPLTLSDTNITILNQYFNYRDSLAGNDTTFILSQDLNGVPLAYSTTDSLSGNDTLHVRLDGTGQAGKFLQTDGTNLNWANPVSPGLLGGVVTYSGTGLVYNVTPAEGTTPDGTPFTAGAGQVTLPAADGTFSRIDVIAVTVSGNDTVLVGTPSANPQLPQIDPSNEVFLTWIEVPAGATEPTNITTETIYDENTEWTPSASGITLNSNNTAAPYHLTKHGSAASWANGNSISYTRSAPISTNGYSALTFYLRLNSSIATNANVTVQFFNGATVVGNPVTLTNAYGFSKTTTSSYMPIAIPISILGLVGDVDRLRFSFTRTSASGFYIDWIQLQGGVSSTQNSNFVTNVYRRADSVFKVINGISTFAFIDSTGGGGGGSVNNAGSGYRLVTTNGIEIKTLVAGTNVTLDSLTANSITINASGGGGAIVTDYQTAVATAGQTDFTFTDVPADEDNYWIDVWGVVVPQDQYSAVGDVITFVLGLELNDKVHLHIIQQ